MITTFDLKMLLSFLILEYLHTARELLNWIILVIG